MTWDLENRLAVVRELALEAGRVLLAGMGHIGSIEYKGAVDMVTDLDRRVEQQLVEGLTSHFPDDTVLAEEGGGDQGNTGWTWYVDPLDGTTNFVHGHPFFAVSIGGASADGLQVGAVYAPYLDELYLATRDGGAVLERPRHETTCRLPRREPVALERALLATGFPYIREQLVDRNVEYLRLFLRANCHGVRRGGSAAIDLAHTAAGKLDGYWEMNLRPWDVAAGTLIARETGVTVTDFGGRNAEMLWQRVVAAVPGLHARMLEILQDEKHECSGE